MADNITFATIPIDWRVPGAYLEIDHTKAVQGLPVMNQKILLLGQRLPTGTQPAGKLVRVTREDDGMAYFGAGSQLAQMVWAAIRKNPYTETHALALDDLESGVAAAGTLTIGGEAGESVSLKVYIGGTAVSVGIVAGEDGAAIAAKLADAVNANTRLPVMAAATESVVTLTAKNKGAEGNAIDVRIGYYQDEPQTVNGLTLAVSPLTGGSGNPDVLDAIAAIASGSYYTIAMPWTDAANLTAMENELQSRWGGMDMRTGHVFVFKSDTYGGLADFGESRNSPHSTLFGLKGSPTLPWVIAAQAATGVQFSGTNDPALPFRGIELPDVLAPEEADRFTDTERNLLLHDGISTLMVDDGGRVVVEQVITAYRKNSAGLEDTSLLKLNTKWTVDYLRFAFRAAIYRDYPAHKLAGDDVLGLIAPGQKIATPKLIRNTLIGEASKLVEAGLMENLEQFKADLKVVRSTADPNRVNAIMPPDVVNQFDVFAGAVQYLL